LAGPAHDKTNPPRGRRQSFGKNVRTEMNILGLKKKGGTKVSREPRGKGSGRKERNGK